MILIIIKQKFKLFFLYKDILFMKADTLPVGLITLSIHYNESILTLKYYKLDLFAIQRFNFRASEYIEGCPQPHQIFHNNLEYRGTITQRVTLKI